jgi:hypothetical protein
MKKLLNENYTPKVETDDSNIRLEYAHESVRLPTGHVISTLPRVHFNYLPEEVFEELKVDNFINTGCLFSECREPSKFSFR